MQLRCRPETLLANLFKQAPISLTKSSRHAEFRRCLVNGSIFGALSLTLTMSAVQADSLKLSKVDGLTRTLIADNSGYDGATLPPPAKKKNQVTVSTDDAPEVTPVRKNKHRHTADVDGDPMTTPDTAGGASLPSPKKGPRANDMPGAKASADKDARPPGPGPEKRGGRDHDPGSMFGKGPLDLTALSLTDDQKQKIAQMHADNGTKMRELMKKRHEVMNQMKDVMFEADVTESQIRAKRDEARQIQEKLEDLRLNDFLAIRAILTPEQKLKLKDVKIANNSNGRGHDGDGPPGGPLRRADSPESKRLADTPPK